MDSQQLQKILEDLQAKEADLLEQDAHTLQTVTEYWDTSRRIHTILAAAWCKGIYRIGEQRVPPSHISEQEAKDAIMMGLLGRALLGTPYGRLPWTLGEWSPALYRTPPESLKRGGRTVRVQFCDDPDTETEYPYWETYLIYDPETGIWTEAEGSVDDEGIGYHVKGQPQVYTTHWRDEARKYCSGSNLTWRLYPDRPRPRDATDGLPAVLSPIRLAGTPIHESTRIETTPPPPDLSRYEPVSPRIAPTAPSTSQRRPATRKRPSKRTAKPSTQKGTKRPKPPEPEEVGATHASSSRRGGHRTRLDTLIRDARDPPGLVFEGRTSQLKTIRHRISGGPWPYRTVSSTWHWVGDSEDASKIIVTFNSTEERDRFAQQFYTATSGVRVFHVDLYGL